MLEACGLGTGSGPWCWGLKFLGGGTGMDF